MSPTITELSRTILTEKIGKTAIVQIMFLRNLLKYFGHLILLNYEKVFNNTTSIQPDGCSLGAGSINFIEIRKKI